MDTPGDGIRLGVGRSILVVDDDRMVWTLISRMLDGAFRVVGLPDGESALAEGGAHRFRVTLLDVRLPGVGGIEVARQLTARGHRGAIVILTGSHDAETKNAAVDAGAIALVTKPCTRVELRAIVEAAWQHTEAPLLEVTQREVRVRGKKVELSRIERSLVWVLHSTPGVVPRERLVKRLPVAVDREHTLNEHISNIRRALREANPAAAQLLVTHRGEGYELLKD